MDTIVIVIVAIIVVLLVCHLLSKKGGVSGGCGTKPAGTPCAPCGTATVVGGNCFPGSEFHIKSGLFDLRGCNDDVYILTNDRSKVHFITES